jgi:MoxR-like ATPase
MKNQNDEKEIRYKNDIIQKISIKQKDGKSYDLKPYFPGDELRKAVNMAIALKRPLLLKGDPGCGKTRLAEAVAYDIYGNGFKSHYFEWNIKSSSKVADGIYSFDHIARLRDAQLDHIKDDGDILSDILWRYIKKGALTKAFEKSKIGKPSILLIDEIDKADIDFPNDLLLELDQNRLEIPEVNQTIIAEEPPIIFITSNDEKDLPPAFLRRCLFHYVEFPKDDVLMKIIEANFPKYNKTLLNKAKEKFEILRSKMQGHTNAEKRVSTSELIDWIFLIKHFEVSADDLDKEGFPLHQALLKSRNDEVNFNKKK